MEETMKDIKIGVVSTYPEMSKLINKMASEMEINLEVREGKLCDWVVTG